MADDANTVQPHVRRARSVWAVYLFFGCSVRGLPLASKVATSSVFGLMADGECPYSPTSPNSSADDWDAVPSEHEPRARSPSDDWNDIDVCVHATSHCQPPRDALCEVPSPASDDWNAPLCDGVVEVPAGNRDVQVHAGCDVVDVVRAHPTQLRRDTQAAVRATAEHLYADTVSLLSLTGRAAAMQCSQRQVRERVLGAVMKGYRFVRGCIKAAIVALARRRSDADSGALNECVVYVQRRKYDEATLRARTIDLHASDVAICGDNLYECTLGPKHVVVTELAWGAVVRRRTADSERFTTVIGKLPSHLQPVERNCGECLFGCFGLQDLGPIVGQRLGNVNRIVDIHCHDECAANLRAENYKRANETDPTRTADLELLCDAHKEAQCLATATAVLPSAVTRLIRLQLSLRGSLRRKFFRECRLIINESLVVVVDGSPSVEATEHRRHVYAMFLTGDSARDRARLHAVSSLWNGDIRDPLRHEHYVTTSTSGMSRAAIVRVMCTTGLSYLLPRSTFALLQRQNWTNSDKGTGEVGLPAHIHNLFMTAYVRAAGVRDARRVRSFTPWVRLNSQLHRQYVL